LRDDNKQTLAEALERMSGEMLLEASRNFSESMSEVMSRAAKVGEVDYNGAKIEVLNIDNIKHTILVHRLGAYSKKDTRDLAQWNEHRPDEFDQNGKPIGYISTSTLSNQSSQVAASQKDLKNPDEVYYAFTHFGENTVKGMSEHDLYTENDNTSNRKYSFMRQNRLYTSLEELARNAERWQSKYENLNHDEVVLDRFSDDSGKFRDGRLQPNYVVSFAKTIENISETTKQHAAYFGVPIILKDAEEYN